MIIWNPKFSFRPTSSQAILYWIKCLNINIQYSFLQKLKNWTIHIVKFCNKDEIPACIYIWNFWSWETVHYLFVLYFMYNIKFPCTSISFNLILHSCLLLQGELVSSFDMDSYSCDRSDYFLCFLFDMEKTKKQW